LIDTRIESDKQVIGILLSIVFADLFSLKSLYFHLLDWFDEISTKDKYFDLGNRHFVIQWKAGNVGLYNNQVKTSKSWFYQQCQQYIVSYKIVYSWYSTILEKELNWNLKKRDPSKALRTENYRMLESVCTLGIVKKCNIIHAH
jgi:hypothetical protein